MKSTVGADDADAERLPGLRGDENARTKMMPAIEHASPADARMSGRNMSAGRSPSGSATSMIMVEAMAIEAIIDPQYDSKMSEPMPATSPTLSPTLSAMTPGLRGSSSGMPASILPTRSAPTSALLVKMPPPTRENSATLEAPIPKPWMAWAVSGSPPKKR